jgi:parvulin-like peptidyl-prolyl isomerase
MWRRIINESMRTIAHGGFTKYSVNHQQKYLFINAEVKKYKTYEIMNKETLAYLDKDIRQGDINSFKLVLGAFLQKDKSDMDNTFDSAVRMVIRAARRRQEVRLLIETHNKESIRKAIFEANMNLKSNDCEPSSYQVQFVLVPDMEDAVENLITKQGYTMQRNVV